METSSVWTKASFSSLGKETKEMLLQQGFRQGDADQCLYTRSRNGHFTCILAYVDDLVLVAERKQEYKEIVHRINKEVEIKEFGDATYYLGIKIEREADRSHLLSQKQKIFESLDTLGPQDAHSVITVIQMEFLKKK